MQQPSRTAATHCDVPLRRRHSFWRQCVIVGHVVSFLLATFPVVVGAAAAGNSHPGELEQLLPSAITGGTPLVHERRLAAANDGGLRFREAAAEASTMAMLLAAERRQDRKLLAAFSPDSSRRAGAKADIGIEALQLRSWAAAGGGLLGDAGDASGRVAGTLRTKLAGELMTVFVLLIVIMMILAAVYFLTGGTMEQMRHDPMGAMRQDASGIYHDPRGALNTAEANAGRYYTDAKGRVIRAEERGVQYVHDGRDRAAHMYHDGVDRGHQFYADHRSASGSAGPGTARGPPPAGGAYAQEYGQAAGSTGGGYGETATQYAQQPQGVQPGTKKFFCC